MQYCSILLFAPVHQQELFIAILPIVVCLSSSPLKARALCNTRKYIYTIYVYTEFATTPSRTIDKERGSEFWRSNKPPLLHANATGHYPLLRNTSRILPMFLLVYHRKPLAEIRNVVRNAVRYTYIPYVCEIPTVSGITSANPNALILLSTCRQFSKHLYRFYGDLSIVLLRARPWNVSY